MQEEPACPRFAVSEMPCYTRAEQAHCSLKAFQEGRPISQIPEVIE